MGRKYQIINLSTLLLLDFILCAIEAFYIKLTTIHFSTALTELCMNLVCLEFPSQKFPFSRLAQCNVTFIQE